MRASVWACLVCAGMPLCAAAPDTVQHAAQRFAEVSARVPAPLRSQFRIMAANVLQARHPELARELMPKGPAAGKSPLGPQEEPSISPGEAAIYREFGRFGQVSNDADRAKLILDLASQVRALPPGATKLELARELCGAVSEGDPGQQAVAFVAETFAEAMKGAQPPDAGTYLELASLIHYEHVPPPKEDKALDAALALLELRDSLAQEARFSLPALDGRIYSLAALRGRVVLVNFWATWCAPCRIEMPELEKLYREFRDQGLVILAISPEERTTVAKFIADKGYSFPVLLDREGKARADFSVDGVPQSFLFDRDGKLVAEAVDRRNEAQFRFMLRQAGLPQAAQGPF